MTLSTGEKIEGPRAYRTLEDKLATAQRAGNKKRVKAIHAKIANIRKDHMHKVTTKLAQTYRQIFAGDVSSCQLAKTKMAKSVLDAGWSADWNALRYKASRHGGTFRLVDEDLTSQIRSLMGVLPPPERPERYRRSWSKRMDCSACGEIHDRDVNAARNILRLGLSAQPPAEESRVAYGR